MNRFVPGDSNGGRLMPVQWSIDRLKPWTDSAEEKVRSWMRFEQWRPNLSELTSFDFGREPERTLERVQERFAELQDNVKAKVGVQIFNRTIALARQWLGAEVREIEISDGPISYWQTNHPNTKDTVLFIHGFGDSKDGVYHMAMHLVPHVNMIALDLPGFGNSFRKPELAYSNDDYGRWLEEFLVKIDAGPLHVVGNSLGGAMAIKIGLLRPDLVASLTLIDPAFVADFRYESVYDEFLRGDVMFQIRNRIDFQKFWARIFHKEPMMPVFIKDFIYEQFRENCDWYGGFIHRKFQGMTSRRSKSFRDLFLNEELPNLKVPTHIIWGEKDTLFPPTFGARAHKLIKGSKFTLMEGVGHAPQVERPRDTAKLIRKFIKDLHDSEKTN